MILAINGSMNYYDDVKTIQWHFREPAVPSRAYVEVTQVT